MTDAERLAAVRRYAEQLRATPDEASTAPEYAYDEAKRVVGTELLRLVVDPPSGAPPRLWRVLRSGGYATIHVDGCRELKKAALKFRWNWEDDKPASALLRQPLNRPCAICGGGVANAVD